MTQQVAPRASTAAPGSVADVPPELPKRRFREFVGRVWSKAVEDNIFFMAGAITFNVLVAFIPLLLLVVGLAGFALTRWFDDPAGELISLLLEPLPQGGEQIALTSTVRSAVESLVGDRTGLSVLGALTFLWISTRLVGTLRTVLREVFDISQHRGMLIGKWFDAQMVLIGSLLIFANLGFTWVLRAVQDIGARFFGLEGSRLALTEALSGQLLALVSIWFLFLLIYRYLPARRIPWRTALVAATFTGLLFEGSKLGFGWYLTSAADFTTAYGNLTTVAVLFFWIYYGAIVFILGGEVAQVYTMRRARRVRTGPTAAINGANLAGLALLAVFAGPGAGGAQGFSDDPGVTYHSSSLEREVSLETSLLPDLGRYVVVHLAENRVFVMEGPDAIWSAPAGTGTGFRLTGGGQGWTFTTPRGLMKIRRKEKNPVWIAPDWHFVERGAPIPPDDHPSRRIAGGLGTTALYLGDGIAIHGTNQPQMLLDPDPERRRISHGCIRLTNEAARDLYHLVSVGTPVLIY